MPSMKKTLLYLALLANLSAQAQITLWDAEGNDISNSEITVSGDPADFETIARAHVKNESETNYTIIVNSEVVTSVEGMQYALCWGLCLNPSTSGQTSGSQALQAGQTDQESFSGHCYPSNNQGTSQLKYTFTATEWDGEVTLTVNYEISTRASVGQLGLGGVSAPYPNPAQDFTAFRHNIPAGKDARVRIFNALGVEVRNVRLQGAGTTQVQTNDLAPGIYFYSVVVNGQAVSTSKLMVRR